MAAIALGGLGDKQDTRKKHKISDDNKVDRLRANDQVLKFALSGMFDRSDKQELQATSKSNLDMVNHLEHLEAQRAKEKLAKYDAGKRILPKRFQKVCRPSSTSFYRSWVSSSPEQNARKWRRMSEIWVVPGAPFIYPLFGPMNDEPPDEPDSATDYDTYSVTHDPLPEIIPPAPATVTRQSAIDEFSPEAMEEKRERVALALQKFRPAADKHGRLVVGNFFTARLLYLQFIQIYGGYPTFKIIVANHMENVERNLWHFGQGNTREEVVEYFNAEPLFQRELCVVDNLAGHFAEHKLSSALNSHSAGESKSDRHESKLFKITNFGKHLYNALFQSGTSAEGETEIQVVLNRSYTEFRQRADLLRLFRGQPKSVNYNYKIVLVLPESVCKAQGGVKPEFLRRLRLSPAIGYVSKIIVRAVTDLSTGTSERIARDPSKETELRDRWGLSRHVELEYESSESNALASTVAPASIERLLRMDFKPVLWK